MPAIEFSSVELDADANQREGCAWLVNREFHADLFPHSLIKLPSSIGEPNSGLSLATVPP
jgi:hypothetical protein